MNSEYLDNYIGYIKKEKNLSDNTVSSYVRDINNFFKYLGPVRSVLDIKKSDLLIYSIFLENSGKSSSTVSRNISSLKNFYSFLLLKGIVDENPVLNITSKKVENKFPAILTVSEVDKLLKQPDANTSIGSRDKAMLELLYATGIKVSELISLDVDDINFDYGYLRCRNSKGEYRVIPVGRVALDSLKDYISEYRVKLLKDDEKSLFLNYSGSRITRQGFWKLLQKYKKKLNIKINITAYTLRHSFAVHMLQNGADIKSVQELLGHSDISTTQMYLRINRHSIKDIYNNAHPRA